MKLRSESFIEMGFVGIKETVEKLKKVVFTGEELYPVVRKASEEMVAGAKNNIPIHTGNLRDSIGFIERSKDKGIKENQAQVIIGARTYGGSKGYHMSLLEKGTMQREMKKDLIDGVTSRKNNFEKFKGPSHWMPHKGKSTGKVEPRKWLTKAFDEHGNAVATAAIAGLNKLADKLIKKQGLKTK